MSIIDYIEHSCDKLNENNQDNECKCSIAFVNTYWRIRLSCSDKRINNILFCPFCGIELKTIKKE